MRNKVFAIVFFVFILAVMVSAPAKMLLTNAGVIETENVGNVIEVEKVYEKGTFGAALFNAVEEIKRDINDIYTNYVPFYVDITSAAESFTQKLNQPVSTFLLELGNKIMLAGKSEEPQPTTSPTTGSDDPTEATQPTEPPFEIKYFTTYLKGDKNHRYYEIMARTGIDDPLVDFYIRVPAKDAETLRPVMEKQAAAINDRSEEHTSELQSR